MRRSPIPRTLRTRFGQKSYCVFVATGGASWRTGTNKYIIICDRRRPACVRSYVRARSRRVFDEKVSSSFLAVFRLCARAQTASSSRLGFPHSIITTATSSGLVRTCTDSMHDSQIHTTLGAHNVCPRCTLVVMPERRIVRVRERTRHNKSARCWPASSWLRMFVMLPLRSSLALRCPINQSTSARGTADSAVEYTKHAHAYKSDTNCM